MSKNQYDTAHVIRHAVNLCMIARGTVSPFMIQSVVNSAPNSEDEKNSIKWRENSLCWLLLTEGHYTKCLHSWAQKDFDDAAAFWLEEFPFLPTAARLGIEYNINNTKDFFSTGERTVENSFAQHCLDLRRPDEGLAAQVLPFNTQKS